MRRATGFGLTVATFGLMSLGTLAQTAPGPSNPRAQKTFDEAVENLPKHATMEALGKFKKADKQDDGRCLECQNEMIECGLALEDWKTAEFAASEMLAEAKSKKEIALAQYQMGEA